MVKIIGLADLEKTFNNIIKGVSANKQVLNMRRGKVFKKFTTTALKNGRLGLKKNTKNTIKIQGQSHPPGYMKGIFVKQIQNKINKDKSVSTGFLASNSNKPKDRHLPFKSREPKTWTQIAIYHHTGFRIPLQGDKGKRVRKFMAYHGIYYKVEKPYIQVPARPFLYNSMGLFEKKQDTKVINDYMDRLWAKI